MESIRQLTENLVELGLIDDFTDCQEMDGDCLSCVQYEDCQDAINQTN